MSFLYLLTGLLAILFPVVFGFHFNGGNLDPGPTTTKHNLDAKATKIESVSPKESRITKPSKTSPTELLSRRECLQLLAGSAGTGLAAALVPGAAPASAASSATAAATTKEEQEAALKNLREVADLQQLAFEFTNAFNFEKAEGVWTRLIEKDPKVAAAWSNRGNCRVSQGNFAGGLSDFARAIELARDEPDPHLGSGVAYEGLGRFDLALQQYEEAQRKHVAKFGREDPVVYNNIANARAGLGQWREAREGYLRAYTLARDYAFPRASEALVLYQLGEDDYQATLTMEKVSRKYPGFADMHAALAAACWAAGDVGRAESNWARLLKEDRRYTDMDWVRRYRRWPPRIADDLERFLRVQ